jgi:phosphoribosyl 1,2-cyclic phosphate phosphodiesterase
VLKFEATFAQTLEMVQQIGARRTLLTHIEEQDELSYDDLLAVQATLEEAGLPVEFAYDTLSVDVG